MSRFIASDLLEDIAELHRGRKKLQPTRNKLLDFFKAAHERLKYDPIEFDATGILAIAEAFRNVILGECYTCYGCAIMPDHVHLLIRKHKHTAEQMIANLQRESQHHVAQTGTARL